VEGYIGWVRKNFGDRIARREATAKSAYDNTLMAHYKKWKKDPSFKGYKKGSTFKKAPDDAARIARSKNLNLRVRILKAKVTKADSGASLKKANAQSLSRAVKGGKKSFKGALRGGGGPGVGDQWVRDPEDLLK